MKIKNLYYINIIFGIIFAIINKSFLYVFGLFILLFIIFILKINSKLKFILFIYLFIDYILGIMFNLYDLLWWYDIFTHSFYGILTCLIGIYVLKQFNMYYNIHFNIFFLLSITLSFTCFWEICEYILSIIFHYDIQDVVNTGVSDTIEDILCATLLSILFILFYRRKKGKIDKLFE